MISYICKGENSFLSTYICNFSKLSLQRVLRTRSHSTLAILKSRNGTDYSVELKRRNQVNELLGIYLAYVVLISVVKRERERERERERDDSSLNHAYSSRFLIQCTLCNVYWSLYETSLGFNSMFLLSNKTLRKPLERKMRIVYFLCLCNVKP